jgi:protein tyrosine/serine phosphatase
MPERGVAFTNVFNFRDLGGYRTADGHHVRWHRLFRSDDLTNLDGADTQRFARLGIRTVVDLRHPEEIDVIGRIPPLPGFAYHHAHLVHPAWPERTFADTAERAEFVRERYREILDEAATGVGQTLRLIADAEAAPLVFHCRAGKDRTGVISAVTLSLLGVPDEDIADDYQLSELAEEASWEFNVRTRPELRGKRWQHITVSPRAAMLGVLADIRAQHGSVAAYAESVGLTPTHLAAMRAHLLT